MCFHARVQGLETIYFDGFNNNNYFQVKGKQTNATLFAIKKTRDFNL
jgi:hypothetical protein